MITLDGAQGEGGGQILRTALGLALATGTPFEIRNIRARRDRPGLQRQHLSAVLAAAEIGQAEVSGAAVGSRVLTFRPRGVRAGDYTFDIGTAGSTSLVLQAVMPGLLAADGPSTLAIEGGTHNPGAPPFDFLAKAFLPLVTRMGPTVAATLERPGFYPAGGGRVTVRIEPAPLRTIELLERGDPVAMRGRVLLSRLPEHIAEREVRTLHRALGWPVESFSIETVAAAGPGNAVILEIESRTVSEVATGFGQKGVPAEKVAATVAESARRYLRSDAPVGEHLADQLLVPMALARAGAFVTLSLTAHAVTNIDVIRQFLDVRISATEIAPGLVRVEVSG